MLENGLLLIQILVMGWVIYRTIQAELAAKKGQDPGRDDDA